MLRVLACSTHKPCSTRMAAAHSSGGAWPGASPPGGMGSPGGGAGGCGTGGWPGASPKLPLAWRRAAGSGAGGTSSWRSRELRTTSRTEGQESGGGEEGLGQPPATAAAAARAAASRHSMAQAAAGTVAAADPISHGLCRQVPPAARQPWRPGPHLGCRFGRGSLRALRGRPPRRPRARPTAGQSPPASATRRAPTLRRRQGDGERGSGRAVAAAAAARVLRGADRWRGDGRPGPLSFAQPGTIAAPAPVMHACRISSVSCRTRWRLQREESHGWPWIGARFKASAAHQVHLPRWPAAAALASPTHSPGDVRQNAHRCISQSRRRRI
jgi:hypothetical protein